jgi:hypothetical protein
VQRFRDDESRREVDKHRLTQVGRAMKEPVEMIPVLYPGAWTQ